MGFFAKDDWSRYATFVSDKASPVNLEPENLASRSVNTRWRVNDLGAGDTRVTLDVTLDQKRTSNYVFLQRPRYTRKTELSIGPTFAQADTIRLIFYDDEIEGDVVEDTGDVASGNLEGIGSWGLWRPAGVAFAAMRIEFDAVSRALAPDNFMEWGRLAFGPAHQFTVGHIALKESLRSKSSILRPSLGGSAFSRKGAHWRVWSIVFRCLVEAEREDVRNFLADNFDGEQFVFGFDETRPQDAWMLAAMINPDLDHASRNFKRFAQEIEEAM